MVSNIDDLSDIYSPNELYSSNVGNYGVVANTKDVRGVWEVPDPVDLSKYIVIGCSARETSWLLSCDDINCGAVFYVDPCGDEDTEFPKQVSGTFNEFIDGLWIDIDSSNHSGTFKRHLFVDRPSLSPSDFSEKSETKHRQKFMGWLLYVVMFLAAIVVIINLIYGDF